MNLKPFRDILINEVRVPIFMFHLPEDIELGVLLRVSSAGGAKLDPYLPNYKKGKFQAIVRSKDYEEGYGIAQQVIAIFKKVAGTTMGNGTIIHFVFPIHDPIPYPVSIGNFIEFSVNFETVYIEEQAI